MHILSYIRTALLTSIHCHALQRLPFFGQSHPSTHSPHTAIGSSSGSQFLTSRSRTHNLLYAQAAQSVRLRWHQAQSVNLIPSIRTGSDTERQHVILMCLFQSCRLVCTRSCDKQNWRVSEHFQSRSQANPSYLPEHCYRTTNFEGHNAHPYRFSICP